MKPTYAIDFESTYTKERSVTTMGPVAYLEHDDTDIYLVSIVGSDGFEWVGNPLEAPWGELDGHEWVSHNRTFDQAAAQALGVFEVAVPSVWHCSADLVAYLGVARSLAKSCEVLYGITPDKSTRDKARGKEWADFSEEEKAEMLEYALEDSRLCLRLWLDYSNRWPKHERALSQHTTLMSHRGIALDTLAVAAGVEELHRQMHEAGSRIPWYGKLNEKGKPIPTLSPKQVQLECARLNIDPPRSMAKDSEEFEDWLAEHGEQAPFVQAMAEYRSLNRTREVLKKFLSYYHEKRLRYGLKYFGAHTGRWSGDSGLNMLNLPRKAKGGVDLRSMLVPAPGHVFISADYAQIEAVALLWMVEDEDQLALIRGGMDPYEAHARQTMGYDDPRPMKDVDPDGRQMAKVRVLGLGYGCGAATFVRVAKAMGGLDLTYREAAKTVKAYRRANPKITAFWRQLDNGIRRCGGELTLTLPSGRDLTYYNVTRGRGTKAEMVRGTYQKYTYGGLLCENVIQATCRDILAPAVLELEAKVGPVVLHVYDEVLLEVPEDRAEEARGMTEQILTKAPDWAEGLPLRAEAEIITHYKK